MAEKGKKKTRKWNHCQLHFTHFRGSEWTGIMNSSELPPEQKAFSIFA